MFDIFVNDQLVAVCAEGVVKLFAETLVHNLGIEFSVSVKRHADPKEEAEKAEK